MSIQYDGPIGPQLPPSANGFVLFVNRHVVTAAWAAPFFVLHVDDVDGSPLLQHCETFEDACWRAERGGRILDARFELVSDELERAAV